MQTHIVIQKSFAHGPIGQKARVVYQFSAEASFLNIIFPKFKMTHMAHIFQTS